MPRTKRIAHQDVSLTWAKGPCVGMIGSPCVHLTDTSTWGILVVMITVSKPTIAVTGGGTGGHVYPALAIAKELKANGYGIIYIGHPQKLEARAAKSVGIDFFGVSSDCFYDFRWHRLLFPVPIIRSVVESARILSARKARALVAVGGFASVPAFLAAQLLQLPSAIHEQNAKPGRANRLFLRFRPLFLTTFRSTERYGGAGITAVHVGCPIDPQIGAIERLDARARQGIGPDRLVVLVLSGSGGAPAVNEAAPGLMPMLTANPRAVVLHVAGTRYYEAVRRKIGRECPPSLRERYRVIPYADPIALYYAGADLIVSRAGAATINEILAVGRPCILIPSPNVAENHQEHNARILEAMGAARVLREVDLSGAALCNEVSVMMSQLDQGGRPLGLPDELKDPHQAAAGIVATVEQHLLGDR